MSDEEATVEMRPIGFVRSPYRDKADIPKGPGAEHRAEGTLELRPELEAGLQDIEGFSHLFVLWLFDRSEGYELVSQVPLDLEAPHGVFASRSPRRPNAIGLSVVELLAREGRRLRVRGVDMLDGTPDPGHQAVPVRRAGREAAARLGRRGGRAPKAERVGLHDEQRAVSCRPRSSFSPAPSRPPSRRLALPTPRRRPASRGSARRSTASSSTGASTPSPRGSGRGSRCPASASGS